MSFLIRIKPGAIRGWREEGILASVIGAQAALEGGWGTSKLAKPPYNNHFGIKASSDWTGKVINMPTLEFINGAQVSVNADFRWYDSEAESLLDHARFFTNTPWRTENYKAVVGETDYKKAAWALQNAPAPYATDPGYAQKLINIIEQNNLQAWDVEAMSETTTDTVATPVVQTTRSKMVGAELTSAGQEYVKNLPVTVIGDSLGVGTRSHLQLLIATANFDVLGSRQLTHATASLDATKVLQSMKHAGTLKEYVVVIIGTNRGVTEQEINNFVDIAGAERKVIFVDTASEVAHADAVSIFYSDAAKRLPNVFYINWNLHATPKLAEYYSKDGANGEYIHMTSTGYKKHAEFIAQALYEVATGDFTERTAVTPKVDYYNIETLELKPDGIVTYDAWKVNPDGTSTKYKATRQTEIKGLFSPYGDTSIYNPEANQQQGFGGSVNNSNWLEARYTNTEETDMFKLLHEASVELIDRSTPDMQYSVSLMEMPDTISIGDTGIFVDHDFQPPLYIRARIISISVSRTNPRLNRVILGNVIELHPQKKDQLMTMRDELAVTREDLRNEWVNSEQVVAEIITTNGPVLGDKFAETDLMARVLKSGVNITDQFDSFKWQRISGDEASDTAFNQLLESTTQSSVLPVVAKDIIGNQSQFVARAYNAKNELVHTSEIVLKRVETALWVDTDTPPVDAKDGAAWTKPDGTQWVKKDGVWEERVDQKIVTQMNDEIVKAVDDANESMELALKTAADFDNMELGGVNLILTSDTPRIIYNNNELAYFWKLANSLSDYALKENDEMTISFDLELAEGAHVQFKQWANEYLEFIEHNTKASDNMAVNALGLVGGSFVTDNPLTSYTPPTTGSSEGQLLVIRGLLRNYLVTKDKKWLDTADFLTDALLNYYYPTANIPTEPDEKWVPHWIVNVTAPFVSREWELSGEVNFVNGVGIAEFEKIFRVFSVRAMDAELKYDWAPDAPVLGTGYEIDNTVVEYGKSKATITLKDKNFTGKALIAYSSETGPIIEIGDKCEAYPVWRPLDEGEIACAVDALPWALDVFNLWHEATGDSKWLRAVESTKASIVSATDVTNTDYYIKPDVNGELVLKDGVTSFSTRSPKETYTNQDGLIIVDYPASAGEGSFGAWVGTHQPFNEEKWIELKLGSDTKQIITFLIDEESTYIPEKRWRADITLNGKGLAQNKLETVELKTSDFYQSDKIVWGAAYNKSSDGNAIASGNSSVKKTIVNESNRDVAKIDFTRGDEGGWMGWAQFMLSIWEYKLPFEIRYKTDSELDFVVNDSDNVKHSFRLPKTGGEYTTIKLTESMFDGTFSNGNYASMVVESVDNNSSIFIDYIGFKTLYDKDYYTNISLRYDSQPALKLAIEYIKPAPSRMPLDYAPYIFPFDFHLINYKVSNLRGAIYTGYQAPWVFQENIFPDSEKALNTNLRFLKEAQDAYEEEIGIRGFLSNIYWWNYRDDYGDNEPNTFSLTGNWGNVWGGFQYRAISDVARVFVKDPNNLLAHGIFSDFIKAVDVYWVNTLHDFPTAFDAGKLPYNNQRDAHMVTNFMRSLMYGWNSERLTPVEKSLITKLLNKCFDYLNHYRVPVEQFDSPVEGTWSPNVQNEEWFSYWGGDILDALAIAQTSPAFNSDASTSNNPDAEIAILSKNPSTQLTIPPIKTVDLLTSGKHRFKHTFKLTHDMVQFNLAIPEIGIKISGGQGVIGLIVNRIKLELGNKPTDHTLALEETLTSAAFSKFEKTINGFRQTVQNTKADKSTVLQMANLWLQTTELVEGQTSQILSMGTNIDLRVTKDDVINLINISENGIVIDGERLWITAETFINNKTEFLETLWKSTNSQSSIDGNRIRVENQAGDYIEMNNTPELRSDDTAGTSVVLGKGRVHFYDSRGHSKGYIGTDMHTANNYDFGTYLSKGSGIYRFARMAEETQASFAYYTVKSGMTNRVAIIEDMVRRGLLPDGNAQQFVAKSNMLAELNGWPYLPQEWPILSVGQQIKYKQLTSEIIGDAYEDIWKFGPSSQGDWRIYFLKHARFEGGFTDVSDRRIKYDIEPTDVAALENIDELDFKQYKMLSDDREIDLGLIAQEAGILRVSDDELEGIDIQKGIMLALKGVQELHTVVKEQAEEIKELKKLVSELLKSRCS